MKPNPLPSLAILQELFRYDAESGRLFWRIRPSPAVAPGDTAGRLSMDGYMQVKFKGQQMQVSRVIWKLVNGQDPKCLIDHINGDKSDNRLTNLREATYSQNVANSKIHRDNTSGLKGIALLDGRWMAQIVVRGKQKYLGMFDTAEEAHAVYWREAKLGFGEFARER